MNRRTAVGVALVVVVLAACGVPGARLPFAVAGSTLDYTAEPARVVVGPDAIDEEWGRFDPAPRPPVEGGHVRVLVVPGAGYRGARVTDVRRVDDAWVVHLTAHETAACTVPDVMVSVAFLVDVEADAPPASVEQTVHVRRGCPG